MELDESQESQEGSEDEEEGIPFKVEQDKILPAPVLLKAWCLLTGR